MKSTLSTAHIAIAVLIAMLAGFGLGRISLAAGKDAPSSASSSRPAPDQDPEGAEARTVADAVGLNKAAIDSLIASGLSGDTDAMLFMTLTQAEWGERIQELQKDGISAEYEQFTDAHLRSAEHWHLLMKGALGESGHLRGKGDRDGEARILESLVNIAEANAGPDRPEFGRLVAAGILEEIEQVKRTRERLDP